MNKNKKNNKRRLEILNPPYSFFDETQQINRMGGAGNGSKYHLFVDEALRRGDELVAITPDGWTMNPKHSEFRRGLIEGGLKSVYFFSRKVFPNAKLMGDVVVFHVNKGYAGPIIIGDRWTSKEIDRRDALEINMLPFTNHRLFGNLQTITGIDTIYRSGKLKTVPLKKENKKYSSTLSNIKTAAAPFKMISRIGGGKNEVLWVDKECESAQYHKVCITKASAERQLTYCQYVPPGVAVSEKICYFVVNNKRQAFNMIEYLNLDYIKTIVWHLKILSHNSKHMFSFIPLLDFSHKITAQDLEIKFGKIDHARPTLILPQTLTYAYDDTEERKNRRKISSEIFTPDEVAYFMANLFDSHIDATYEDITCGDGQLLAACERILIESGSSKKDAQARLVGYDMQSDNIEICRKRFPYGTFAQANSLTF